MAICATPEVSGHFRFCESFLDAAGSTCRNIAEGFARFGSAEIVRFFRYSLASLSEVQDHITECLTRKFISDADFDRLWDLSEHVKAASINFMNIHRKRLEQARRERAARRRRVKGPLRE